MQPFRKLLVWQKAHQVTLRLYKETADFPSDERYGLTSQIRRSAASICANLAEGCGRQTRRDFARFAYIAVGSASELEYHLLLATDLGIIERDRYSLLEKSVVEVKRMLAGLIRKLMTDDR
ncbi:MAG: diversity-generating retroelement protein bAvd family protein [Gemmatimonadetes bacterium]|nr:MAG: diversity-generating retroelement protein bAvd family protein [Gemmatimonadota bacterium]